MFRQMLYHRPTRRTAIVQVKINNSTVKMDQLLKHKILALLIVRGHRWFDKWAPKQDGEVSSLEKEMIG